MIIASSLEKTAFYFLKHLAVIYCDRVIPCAHFNRDARRIASALNRRGIQPGDQVGMCAPNSYKWLVFYFGVIGAGAVAITFSHLLTKEELACHGLQRGRTDDSAGFMVHRQDGKRLAGINAKTFKMAR